MQDFEVSHGDAGMTSLVVFISIMPTEIGECTILLHLHLINKEQAHALAGKAVALCLQHVFLMLGVCQDESILA